MSVRTVQLGDFIEISKGKKALHLFERPAENTRRYLQIDDLRPDAKQKFVEPFNCPQATKSDVVIAWDGANAGTVSCNLDGYIGSTLAVLRPTNGKIFAPYLARFLESNFSLLKAQSTGATVPHLDREVLERLEIPLLDLSEQKRIAGVLEQVDRLRRTRRYALELSDTFLPAAFLELFGDPVKNPRDLQHTTLEEELERIESGFSPVCEGPRQQSNQWAVLGLGAVTSGVFKPEENKFLPPDIPARPKLEVQDGDVLVTRKNTYDLVAACTYVRRPPPRLLLPDTIFRFRLKERSRLTPVYLWGLLSFPSFKKRVQRLASGSAGSMPGISKEKFMSVRCPVPPSALQQSFSALVSRHEQICTSQREALRQANHLFQSLLHRAFTVGI